MNLLETKLPKVGTTIFTIMSQLAEQHQAINLSQGFPDFQPPARLVELVSRHLAAGRNQYAPMIGAEPLREAIADKLRRIYDAHVDPVTDVTVTAGATEALFCAIHAVVRAGDEVIVLDPAYDSYEPAVELAGGRAVHVPLAPPGFAVDWDRLEAALCDRTRLVVINSPHNPTGALLGEEDLNRLAALLRPFGTYVLSDEVYEHIVFDGARHATVLAHPELAQRSFAVFSFGKTYHATGWKVGYTVAPRALTEELRKVHQYVCFSVVTPLQHALADFVRERPQHFQTLAGFYAQKRDVFVDLLRGSRFSVVPSRGTYFQLADYGAISKAPDTEFVRSLTQEHGVAAIPVSVFYAEPPSATLVRFCFAKENATLEAAAERLARV
ncbi:MAG: aminotransferase class I/II-fold pyridoxal phosphate-dependent enzyme [Gammaproteobacteria bacterium]|nr:aminotransferase class I/II-fold pyridoxal phosphate-dependent enzyme [Gammaproteobacteria bacterium]